MKTTLVSIISDQTIPNLIVIKELQDQYDNQLFITTEYVEKKGIDTWIEKAAGIEQNSIKRIKVVEDDLNDIRQKLENSNNPNTNYIVNMSGGTKVMTIGIYEFFAKEGNKIIYVPIGKNAYKEIFPNTTVTETEIKYRIGLSEYLTAYGLFYEPKTKLLKEEKFTQEFFSEFRKKRFNFNRESRIIESQQLENSIDRVYFSGAWFEEYAYSRIIKDFVLDEKSIGINVELKREENSNYHDNEYDVMFVYENQLYVVECKASVGGNKMGKDNLEKYMYKLAAVTRDFGLKTNSAIFTLTNINKRLSNKLEWLEKRKKILGIKAVADAEFFLKNQDLKTMLNINPQ